MMKWATREAAKFGLEIHTEGSPLGSSLYTEHDNRILQIAELNPTIWNARRGNERRVEVMAGAYKGSALCSLNASHPRGLDWS